MLNKLKNDRGFTAPAVTGWRTPALFVLIILMMGSLFVSRAMLSVVMGVFVLVAFWHTAIAWQLRNFLSQPLLWGMSLLFLVPLLSGLWSDDHEQWLAMMRIKLPLLVLPLAFAAPMRLSEKQWKIIGGAFIFLITVATIWCLFQYVENSTAINESYLKAKAMRTPLGNDRVRFSWLVAVGVLIAAWLCRQRNTKDIYWWILLMITGWLIVFLHLLAVRTGVFSFYIMLVAWIIHLFWQKQNRVQALGVLATLVVLPFIAYLLLPSFRNRVKYIRYEFDYFKQANYLPGSNDAMRVISIKAGWQVMNAKPLTGVGFGDVLKEAIAQYDKKFPDMLPSDKILPGSEWMMYGSGAGWPGFLIFTFVMGIPFFIPTRHRLLWWLLNATAAFSFLFDIGLEVQFGVFVWAFITLCLGKYVTREDAVSRAAGY